MSDKDEVFFGEVVFFIPKRCYGFISWEKDGAKQPDMFVYFSDINCKGFKVLFKGQKVSFKIGTNDVGKPKAVDVTVLKN